MEPKKWVFQGHSTQKMRIFAQKWPKNTSFGQNNSVIFGIRRSVQSPPILFCRCLTHKNICCSVWKPGNGCFKAAPPKIWPFFAQKWPTIVNFGPKTAFFGLGWLVQGPPTLFCRCLTQKKICCRVWKPETWSFRAAPPFLPKNGLKNPILGQKHCFWGLGGEFKPPQPCFAGSPLKTTWVAWYGIWKMGVSGPPHAKIGPFLAKNGNFGQKGSDFWAWVLSLRPPSPIF